MKRDTKKLFDLFIGTVYGLLKGQFMRTVDGDGLRDSFPCAEPCAELCAEPLM
jgi:hypothetical protein